MSKAFEIKSFDNIKDKEINYANVNSKTQNLCSLELFDEALVSKNINSSDFKPNSPFKDEHNSSSYNSNSFSEDKQKKESALEKSPNRNASVSREDVSPFTNKADNLTKSKKDNVFRSFVYSQSVSNSSPSQLKESNKLCVKKKRIRSRDQINDKIIKTNYQNDKIYSSDDAISPNRLKRSKYDGSSDEIKFESLICSWCSEENQPSLQKIAEHNRTCHPNVQNNSMLDNVITNIYNGVKSCKEELHGCCNPVGMHPCGMCGLVFVSTLMLDQHVALEHHKAVPLPCSFCPIKFFDPGALQLHINTIHLKEHSQKGLGPAVSTIYCCQCSHPCSNIYALADHMHEQHGYNQNKKNSHLLFSSFPYIQFLSQSLGQSLSQTSNQSGSDFSPYHHLHQMMIQSTVINQMPLADNYSNLSYNYNIEKKYIYPDNKLKHTERKFDQIAKYEHVDEQYTNADGKYERTDFESECNKRFISDIETNHSSISSYLIDTKSPQHNKYSSNKNLTMIKNIKNSLTPPFCNVVTCPECNNTFNSHHNLMDHIYTHYIGFNNSYVCSHCSKLFGSPTVLQKHFTDMHSQHLYRCNLCKQIFDSKVDLQVHFGVKHTSECEVITCLKCDTTFQSQIQCQLHVKEFHLGQQPQDIFADFNSMNMLSVSADFDSMPGVSSDVGLRCLFCVERFASEADLVNHIAQHKKQFVCQVCGEDFLVEYLLDKHMEARHGNNEWLGRNALNRISKISEEVQSKSQLSKLQSNLTSEGKLLASKLINSSSQSMHHRMQMHLLEFNNQANNINDHSNIIKEDGANKKELPISFVEKIDKIDESISPSAFSSKTNICKCEKCHEKFSSVADFENHLCFLNEEIESVSQNENQTFLKVENAVIKEQNNNVIKSRIENSTNNIRDIISPLFFDRYRMEQDGLHMIGQDGAYMSCQSLDHTPAYIDSKLGSHACVYCKQTFKSKGDMDRHCKSHQVPPNHKCNICDDVFSNIFVLAKHKLTHCKVIVGNICTVCKASLHSEEEFILHCHDHAHMQSLPKFQHWLMQPNANLACAICRQTLTSNIDLHLHAQHHFQNENTESKSRDCCEICHQSILSAPLHPSICNACLQLPTKLPQFAHLQLLNLVKQTDNTKLFDEKVYQQIKRQLDQLGQIAQNNSLVEDCQEYQKEEIVECEDNNLEEEIMHPQLYQCIKCQNSFSSELEVQLHVASHVLCEGNVHSCLLCGFYFDSPARLQLHLIQHAISTATNCAFPLVTNNISLSTSIKENELAIEWDDLNGKDKDELITISNDENKVNKSILDESNRSLMVNKKIDETLKTKNDEFTSTKNNDVLLLTNNRDELPLIQKNDGHLMCYVCFNELRGKASEVQAHMLQHGLHTRKFACSQCSQRFYFVSELDNHVLDHLGKTTCGKFKKIQFLGEKITDICSKLITVPELNENKFNNANEMETDPTEILSEDMQFGGRLPDWTFDCDECQLNFVLYEDFARHRNLHLHNNICHLCNMTYANLKMLEEHKASAHSSKAYDVNIDLTCASRNSIHVHTSINDSVNKNLVHVDTLMIEATNKNLSLIRDKSNQKIKKDVVTCQQSCQSMNEKMSTGSDLISIEDHDSLVDDENSEINADKSYFCVYQPINCPICKKKISKKERLKDHLKIHSIKRVSSNSLHFESKLMSLGVHACPICGGRFTQLDQLTHHIHKIHNKLSPSNSINDNKLTHCIKTIENTDLIQSLP